jgi:2',3'-cyclic-nucleotide 2'-phosphodiesterase (5'-nucleotidase family)
VEETRKCVAALKDSVDLIVVLGHMGLPGPMQTDAENEPSIQRPLDEDLRFCAEVPGIHLYIAAHSHHGLDQPIIHPDTGTIITQTYGYGTRLGRIRLSINNRKITRYDVQLLKVWTDKLPAHPAVTARMGHYQKALAPRVGPVFGQASERITRKYNAESPLGSLVTDAMRKRAQSDVALTNAGGLRADIPQGSIDSARVLDAFPFLNTSVTLALSGGDLRQAIEQGLSLKAGMVQVSGIQARFDLKRAIGERLVSLEINGQPLDSEKTYTVTTNSFMAEGGDGYISFKKGKLVRTDPLLSEVVSDYVKAVKAIAPPKPGRLQS